MQRRMPRVALPARTRNRALSLLVAVSVPALVASQAMLAAGSPAAASTQAASVAQQPLTPALAAQLSKNVSQHVVVIMKHQFAAAHVGSNAALARTSAVASAQAPVVRELRQVHAAHLKTYSLVNALAATVSAGEVARLKANPSVAEVIPDVIIHGAAPTPAPAPARKQAKPRASTVSNLR